MDDFEIEVVSTKSISNGAKIKAIGVGGGGGNMINHMIREGVHNIDLIVANTDAQALSASSAAFKMQLGIETTRGLGAGMIPERGREAALESFEDIKMVLAGADIVFISAGLGGGTGTGAAPIVAQAAKEVGALTISIVTSPFSFEGKKRSKLAKEGLEELKRESDCIIVVPNEKLLSVVEKNLGIKESFKLVDDILSQAVGGITNVILHDGGIINLDFNDVKTVMSHKGLALMGVGYSAGTNAAYDATKAAIESPLLDNISIDGAMGVLVHMETHPDYPIIELSQAMNIVQDNADEDANVIFGTTYNTSMEIDAVKVTIIATGFDGSSPTSISIHSPSLKNENSATQSHNTPNRTPNNTITNRQILGNMGNRKVMGSDYGSYDEYLDVPSFLRKQMD